MSRRKTAFIKLKPALYLFLAVMAVTALVSKGDFFLSAPSGPGAAEPASGLFSVAVIDVGQGDSLLVSCKGSHMLVDAGTSSAYPSVKAYLKKQGVSKLDILVATHPHEDHIGGMDKVIRDFDIGEIIMPKVSSDTAVFERLLGAVSEKGLKITQALAGLSRSLGDAELLMISPQKGAVFQQTNDYSAVIRVSFDGVSFILTGDAEKAAEQQMLKSGCPLSADVLKVGHHGSSSSSSQAFLAAVSPHYAVISAGKGNPYGHPHPATLDALSAAGAACFRTDSDGTVLFTVSDGRLSVSAEKTE